MLFHRTLSPSYFKDSRGVEHPNPTIIRRGPKKLFVEHDLYTTRLSSLDPTLIERQFFGQIDREGQYAVEYFENFSHPSANERAFYGLVRYMSTQKLRTPKGLDFLAEQINTENQNHVLAKMVGLRNLYCAIWTECIWQIADASQSTTKFIISDHPVTVYNRGCGPRSSFCKGHNDPDICLNATHTIFPLSWRKAFPISICR